jgi:hypothetical protein
MNAHTHTHTHACKFIHHVSFYFVCFKCVTADGAATAENTLVFRLEVECTRNKDAPDNAPDDVKYKNSSGLAIFRRFVIQLFASTDGL